MRRIFLVCVLFVVLFSPLKIGNAQSSISYSEQAQSLLERMSPEERVGQLFLVTFTGNAPQPEDPIFDLIVNYHVSGVLLTKANDNFVESPETLIQIRELIGLLQDAEYDASLIETEDESGSGESTKPVYIPLFIAVGQEGGGAEYSEILSGLTELPSQMAIGATWNTEMARNVGEVLGKELEALGFNLLLGPSLDILGDPRLVGPGDLGVRSFGGDPFWVSMMGRAYVAGLHEGSRERLGIIVKHFPGLGSADRSIEEEVATVRKSLEQLKQVELAPFFALTGSNPGSEPEIADGLLISHIRYQGFQGNIRATTRPVSLDPQAHDQLMALEPLVTWRANGGITVSDSLGSRAVRRFRDPLERTFKAHLVARDAFLAGNDLLLLSNFKSPDDPDEVTTIRSTIDFFIQKYREDSAFAERVDDAVLRIIQLKQRLCGENFLRTRVGPIDDDIAEIGLATEVTFQVARESASLISPSQEEIEERLGGSPALNERILFFTDVRLYQQCSTCSPKAGIGITALEDTVNSLYGQTATGEVGSWNMQSFTMADLANYLGEPPTSVPVVPLTSAEQLSEPLLYADWLVFSVLDNSEQDYGSNALKLLLDQRPDLAREKRVVVFAYDVPYGLDVTDISKVDVYYALYSQGYPFVDVAAHLLFLEFSALGAPPVSVPGIGYDLIEVTSPDPNQVIALSIYTEGEEIDTEGTEPEFFVGDLIPVETGVILDANGHPVPDGTVVEFYVTQQGEGNPTLSFKTTTQAGVARVSIPLERLGLLTISAGSDPARISETLQLNVQEDVPALATVISPTRIPTATILPTVTVSPTTPVVAIEDEQINQDGTTATTVGFTHLIFGLLGVAIVGSVGYSLVERGEGMSDARIRSTLLPVIGGLMGYNYLALNLPGSDVLLQSMGVVAGVMLSIGLGTVGLLIATVWNGMSPERFRKK
jgi:beta-N-acetylhexosaminidase